MSVSITERHRVHRATGRAGGWKTSVRDYFAALMLSVAVVSALPSGNLPTRPSIVRTTARRRAGFDPRELSGPGTVITLPLELGSQAPTAIGSPELN